MIEPGKTWKAARRWRRLPVLLLGVLLFQACGGCPSRVGEGPLFQAQEAPPPGKALVYLYWPPGEKGALGQIDVHPSETFSYIRQGGYSRVALEPGDLRFVSWTHWILSYRTDVAMDLGELEMEARAGETYFIRIEEKPRLVLLPGVEMRPVEAAAALPEIRKCRQMFEVLDTPLQIDAAGNVVAGS